MLFEHKYRFKHNTQVSRDESRIILLEGQRLKYSNLVNCKNFDKLYNFNS